MWITGTHVSKNKPPTPTSQPDRLADLLTTAPPLDCWAAGLIHVVDNGRLFAAAILRGEARAVSDGSFKNEMGTSASVLYHSTSKDPNHMVGVNAIPGNCNEQSAYRSELAGILGSIAITAAICQLHDIQDGSITFGLDGIQALRAAAGNWPLNPEPPDFDLITDIRAKLKRLPIWVHWKWAEGHQDYDHSSVLDEWAHANIMADNLAKAFWNHLNQSGHTLAPLRLGDEAWVLHFQGQKLNCVNKAALYHAIHDPTARAYWIWHGQLQASDIPNIDWGLDWGLIGNAFQSLTAPKKRRTTKHAAGHFGCGIKMKTWRFQNHAECP
jgi:hypothetical protein